MSGEGGGKLFTPAEMQTSSSSGEQRGGSSAGRAPPVVSFIEAHGSSGNPSIKPKVHGSVQHLVEMNMIWFVIVGLSSLFVLVFVLFVIFMCNRSSSSSMRGNSDGKKKNASRVAYERNMRLLKTSSGDGDVIPNEMSGLPSNSDEIDAQQQQQLIQQANNNGNNKSADIIMQSQHQMITAHISCSNSSSNSTLLKV